MQATIPSAISSNESHSPSFRASGLAFFTARSHSAPAPNKITFFANSFCPFAHRIWIALEIKGIPYQMVEVMPPHLLDGNYPPQLLQVNPEAITPCIRHGNWAVWESGVIMEYFEDLSMGRTLLPLANPQLRAHCRLWTDHINRKILPSFYSLLLTPPPPPPPPPPPSTQMQEQEQMGNGHVDNGDGNGNDSHVNGSVNRDMTSSTEQHDMLIATLQKHITSLVNASHATGPFFLGSEIGYVDVAFAPWIIRLSRVLSYYRNFPRPEVGTRWRSWVDAVESDERVRRTLSEENSYHGVYRGVGEDGFVPGVVGGREFLGGNADPATSNSGKKIMAEIEYARKVVAQEGFGLGGDVWGRLGWEAGGMANGS